MTLLNDKFEILPEQPLPEYDTAYAQAYGVRAKGQLASIPLIALVCTNILPTRSDLLASERSLSHAGLLLIKDCGVVFWTPAGIKTMAFIYEKPAGRKLMPLGGTSCPPQREDRLITHFLTPLANALRELKNVAVFHGCIRPDNIYVDEASGRAILGDHLAMPVAFKQPTVFETIPRALAPHNARGIGTFADDLYALGVTLVVALTGEQPLRDLSDTAIVQLKMERGSYIAMMGERRFGSGLTEVLRGLLADDPDQRWTHDDLEMWLNGRRLTPKQSLAARKASRPLRLGGQEFFQARQLAMAMTADTKVAATMVKNEEIAKWLSHGLNDEEMTKYYDEALLFARRAQRAGPEDERLVASAVMVLHPLAPMRYRGVSVFPQGFPLLLASLMSADEPVTLLVEMVQNAMSSQWIGVQKEKPPEMVAAIQIMEKAKETLEKTQAGFGVERVLYDSNPTMPCISPIVRSYYPLTMRQLLEALEKRAREAGVMDRHIAAFMLARDRKIMPQVMRMIDQSGGDSGKKGLALLTLYSDLQYRYGPDRLPGIAAALMPMVQETVKRFKNRARQDKALKDLKIVAAEGDLSGMLGQIDDPDLLERDAQEFAAAKMLYQQTQLEIERMQAYTRNKKAIALQAGEPLAAVIAVSLAFVAAIIVIARILF